MQQCRAIACFLVPIDAMQIVSDFTTSTKRKENAMERIYAKIEQCAAKARIAWELVKLVAIAIAWLVAAWLVVTNIVVLAKIVAVAMMLAIGWPMVKMLRCYVAARILLAKLIA